MYNTNWAFFMSRKEKITAPKDVTVFKKQEFPANAHVTVSLTAE